jgi:hypothetical protein
MSTDFARTQTETEIPKSLVCNVQALGVNEDCDLMLVSDGRYWFCPKGHIQGFDLNRHPIRKLRDMRAV